VKMNSEFTFEPAEDIITLSEEIDDILSEFTLEGISKNRHAISVVQEDIKLLGSITLKIRY
jgi:hypothetical protein